MERMSVVILVMIIVGGASICILKFEVKVFFSSSEKTGLTLSLSQHFLFVSNGFSSTASRLFHQIRVASFLPAPSMETYFSFFAALLSHILLLPILPHIYCPTKTTATNKQTSIENKDNKQAWKCNKHNKQTDPSYKQIQQAYPHIPGRLCSFPAVLLRLLSFVNS